MGIALLLVFSMTLPFVALPSTSAADPGEGKSFPTWIKVWAGPNPAGVGQELYIMYFITTAPLTATYVYGDIYDNIKLEITSPDGKVTTFDNLKTASTGSSFISFTPDQVGEYKVKAYFGGMTLKGYNDDNPDRMGQNLNLVGAKMLPSESEISTVTIQEEPIQTTYITPSLPTEYWSRPIQATNWNWGPAIGGHWFGATNVAENDPAPLSSHILWNKATKFGGQPGGVYESDMTSEYIASSAPQKYFKTACTLNGILYYYSYYGMSSKLLDKWTAVDMKTGEVLWERPAGTNGTETILRGQIIESHTVQEDGASAWLWSFSGGTLKCYDAFTGEWLFNIVNASSTLDYVDMSVKNQGGYLGWRIVGNKLQLWNQTQVLYFPNGPKTPEMDLRVGRDLRPLGNIDYSNGIMWSVDCNFTINGVSTGNLAIGAKTPECILLRSAPNTVSQQSAGYQVVAGINAMTGDKLWGPFNQTIPDAKGQDISLVAAGQGVYVLASKTTDSIWGYSLKTGQLLWGPVKLVGNGLSSFFINAMIAYGNVYTNDFGGYINCVDLETGEIEWTFTRGSAGYDTPYGVYPTWYASMGGIAGGMIFLPEGELYSLPMHPAYQLAVNATDGTLVWKILEWAAGGQAIAVGDGMLANWNSYDGKLYVFGKGPTATTVSIKDDVVTNGNSVLITGRVIDTSPGTASTDLKLRFPDGVAAVSEDSMESWMEYLYMQQTRPNNATGVPVTLSVVDGNGNYRVIGTAVTDADGFYSYNWKPDIDGKYTVYASFGGSNSYYSSNSETAFLVEPAPATPTPVATPAPSIADQYFVPAIIGVIVAIIVVGAVTVLLLRKKP